jgi:hypothetical protein
MAGTPCSTWNRRDHWRTPQIDFRLAWTCHDILESTGDSGFAVTERDTEVKVQACRGGSIRMRAKVIVWTTRGQHERKRAQKQKRPIDSPTAWLMTGGRLKRMWDTSPSHMCTPFVPEVHNNCLSSFCSFKLDQRVCTHKNASLRLEVVPIGSSVVALKTHPVS